MTLDEHLDRISWRIQSIRAKAGSPEAGPLEVALADYAQLMVHAVAIGVDLARRFERASRREKP